MAAGPDGIPPGGTGQVVGYLPAIRPDAFGDASFRDEHGLRFAYVSGAMANGIGSVEIAQEMGRAGMLGIFGAAGLSLRAVEAAIDRLSGSPPHGFNLIHSPNDPSLEKEVVDLYLRRGVRLVEASAYLDLTLPVVRYRVKGIGRDPTGRVVAPNKIIAKISRVEVAVQVSRASPGAVPPRTCPARGDHRRASRMVSANPDGRRRDRRGGFRRSYGQPAGHRPDADHAGAPRPLPGSILL